MEIHVPSDIDKAAAIDLELRGRGKERHGEVRESVCKREKLL
jgi:hypothetical protein